MGRIACALALLVGAAPALASATAAPGGPALALCLAQTGGGQEGGGKVKWTPGKADQDFGQAASLAQQDTMVYFAARWEPACGKLDEGAFSDDEVVRLAEKWQCLMVDLNEPGTYGRARARYKLAGLPTVRFYARDGRMVDEVVAAGDADVFVRKLKGEGRIWKSQPLKLDPNQWHDTHRIYLRNGGMVDGVLKELSEQVAVVQWDPQSEVQFKRDEIVRVEMITIRRLGEEPPDLTGKRCVQCGKLFKGEGPKCEECARGPGDVKCPVCGKRMAAGRAKCPDCDKGPIVVDPAVKERVDKIIAQMKEAQDKSELVETLAKVGTDGLIYAATLVDQVAPELAQLLVSAITKAKEKRALPILRDKALAMKDSGLLLTTINALVVLDDKAAMPVLQKLLSSESALVRGAVVESIGSAGGPYAMRDLCKAVIDSDRSVRLKATPAIINWARRNKLEGSVYFNLRGLSSGVAEQRREQIPTVLSQLGLKEGISLLMDFLRSRLVDLRVNAIYSLGDLEAKEAAEQFYNMLEVDKETRVKVNICGALAKFKDINAAPRLIELMARETDTDVSLAATRALQIITKQRFGPDPAEWKKWWEAQRGAKPEK